MMGLPTFSLKEHAIPESQCVRTLHGVQSYLGSGRSPAGENSCSVLLQVVMKILYLSLRTFDVKAQCIAEPVTIYNYKLKYYY